MLKSKLTLQVNQSGLIRDDVVMLGESFMKQWKIPDHQPVHLRFGSHKQQVSVISVPR